MELLIKNVLKHWRLENATIDSRFHEDSSRQIYLIIANDKPMLLKGIPDAKSEEVIKGNVFAHEYLGNKKHIAPELIYTQDGERYVHKEGYFFYLMEFIQGRALEETPEDEYALGKLAKTLHSYDDYKYPSGLNEDKNRFYEWFKEKPFKKEFDNILDEIPKFSNYNQCFIHTDIGPHNAMMKTTGEVVLIDLDDAGIGCRYLDMGWPFIMQFVDYNHTTEEMKYRFDLAEAFLQGYYGDEDISREEYDLIWQGAIYMHISYMKTWGPYAVDSLWNILKFGMDHKEILWNHIKQA